MTSPDVRVSEAISAPPMTVWEALADPSRIASWSPENTGVSISSSGPAAVGTTFGGSNRHGLFRWSTTCTVIESEPGRAFAFDVSFWGLSVARWRYEITETESGCLLEEQWWDQRGGLLRALGPVGTGVRDRAAHNAETMRQTLAAMRAEFEER